MTNTSDPFSSAHLSTPIMTSIPPTPPPPPPPPATNAPPQFPPPPQFQHFPPHHTVRPPPPATNFFNSSIPSPYHIDQPVPITIPIPLKLTHNNFLPWQAQMLPLINGHNLARFLTSPPPNPMRQASGGQIEFNQDYLIWHRQDQLLLGWLRSALSESVSAQAISCSIQLHFGRLYSNNSPPIPELN